MYSNCLFEALKAKIKDPKNVQIHLVPPSLNHFDLHFYWVDEVENRVFHYTAKNSGIWAKLNIFLFKGYQKGTPIILFEELLYKKMRRAHWSLKKQVKTARYLGFRNKEPFEIERD